MLEIHLKLGMGMRKIGWYPNIQANSEHAVCEWSEICVYSMFSQMSVR